MDFHTACDGWSSNNDRFLRIATGSLRPERWVFKNSFKNWSCSKTSVDRFLTSSRLWLARSSLSPLAKLWRLNLRRCLGSASGTARVSTGGQKLDRQIDALRAAGCRRIFEDKKSGKDTDRVALADALDFLCPGDTLVVPSLDRLSRSLHDSITMVAELRRGEVGFTSLHESLDTTTPGGRLVFHVFAALAEFIRELIVSGTRAGLTAARDRGRVGGRPTVVTPEIIRAARDMLPNPENSITSIAKILGVSPGTLYNHIPDLHELRALNR